MKIVKKKKKIKLFPLCTISGCDQQAYLLPDFSKPPVHHKEPSTRKYKEADESSTPGGDLTSLVSYTSEVHETGLCYFHLKKYENMFTAKYPLKGQNLPLGRGGLKHCPIDLCPENGQRSRE